MQSLWVPLLLYLLSYSDICFCLFRFAKIKNGNERDMIMEKKKYRPYRRSSLTGEDIDMLHERQSEPESRDDSGNYRYKDHIDGA